MGNIQVFLPAEFIQECPYLFAVAAGDNIKLRKTAALCGQNCPLNKSKPQKRNKGL